MLDMKAPGLQYSPIAYPAWSICTAHRRMSKDRRADLCFGLDAQRCLLQAHAGANGQHVGFKGPNSLELSPFPKQIIENEGSYIASWPQYAMASNDHALQTSEVNTCAVLVVIGPKKHYMLHLSGGPSIGEIENHLRQTIDWPLASSKIYILPGMHFHTESRVSDLLKVIRKIDAKSVEKVQFVHYPESVSIYGKDLNEKCSIISWNNKIYYAEPSDETTLKTTRGLSLRGLFNSLKPSSPSARNLRVFPPRYNYGGVNIPYDRGSL